MGVGLMKVGASKLCGRAPIRLSMFFRSAQGSSWGTLRRRIPHQPNCIKHLPSDRRKSNWELSVSSFIESPYQPDFQLPLPYTLPSIPPQTVQEVRRQGTKTSSPRNHFSTQGSCTNAPHNTPSHHHGPLRLPRPERTPHCEPTASHKAHYTTTAVDGCSTRYTSLRNVNTTCMSTDHPLNPICSICLLRSLHRLPQLLPESILTQCSKQVLRDDSHKPSRALSRKGKKASKAFQPVKLVYEEDSLRRTFFSDHPWELARPRVLSEESGDEWRGWDWSRGIRQRGKRLDGER